MVSVIHSMALGVLILVLTNQWLPVAVVGMSGGTLCSNSVPLTKNVNGDISFKPGATVAVGSNITIHCHGIHAQPPKKTANPADYTIRRIHIFGPNLNILHSCSLNAGLRECKYTITEKEDLGKFTYHCQFQTRLSSGLSCVSSKNLSITDNECLLSPSPCHQDATCEKTNSSFQCKCNNGFTGNGKNCTDIQECLEPSSCPANSNCVELTGSFECRCKQGFVLNGKDCRRKPSCIFNSTCKIENDIFNCKSSDPSLQHCHCRKNFIGNGTHCISECQSSPSLCHQDATCEKTNSSFQCKCNNGFTGDGMNCTDIQECLEPLSCPGNTNCVELRGSFECRCKQGFVPDGKGCRRIPPCIFNSTCQIENDLFNCKSSDPLQQGCNCRKNFIGNGTHCILAIPKSGPNKSNEDSTTIIIIVAVVVSLTLLIIFALSISFCHKRKITREETFNRAVHELNKGRLNSKNNLEILYPAGKKDVAGSPRRKLPSIREHNSLEEEPDEGDIISYICVLDDWEIERKNLTILDKKLGGGCFGIVKKGLYKDKENDKTTVAVKMLKESPSAADRSDLLMELHILKEVNKSPHPNVIQLIGAFTSEEPILVITEFCARGNLRNLLRKSRLPAEDNENNTNSSEYKNIFSTLSHKILLQMAVDTANGMQHLAANQFVHRDLSARNILIGENYEAKVSDFGLARPITGVDQMYVKSNRNLLPVKWMAVESLTHGVFRTSSDVWAFGVVLWEITTLGEEPYPEISPFETFTLVASGKRMERPPQCSEELYNIMTKCWHHEHDKRPSFKEIHGKLKEMLKETDNRVYINVVELHEESGDILQDDRRISVESLGSIRYTNG